MRRFALGSRRRHLREILALQHLAFGDGEARRDSVSSRRVFALVAGCAIASATRSAPALGSPPASCRRRRDGRHLGDELLDQGAPAPEDAEGLIEDGLCSCRVTKTACSVQ